jgi:hypothetical protein
MSVVGPTTSEVYSVGKAEKITIEKSIDEVRKGNGYFASCTVVLTAGDISYIYMKPLKTTVVYHMSFRASSDSATEMWVYEGTGSQSNTGSNASATILTPFNLNRNNPTGSVLFISGIITGATGGTGSKIYTGFCPSYVIMKYGSSESRQNEIIINSASPYIIGISGSGGRVGFESYWYEQ